MKTLYVLYDAECALCRRCKEWLQAQPAFLELRFIALQSAEAARRFPGIGALDPGDQLLVVNDTGDVYKGPYAWIMCLYALREYREWSQRLAHTAAAPVHAAGMRAHLGKPSLHLPLSLEKKAGGIQKLLAEQYPDNPQAICELLTKRDAPDEPTYHHPDRPGRDAAKRPVRLDSDVVASGDHLRRVQGGHVEECHSEWNPNHAPTLIPLPCIMAGMDARRFLDTQLRVEKTGLEEWLSAGANVALGMILLWGVAREAGHGLLAGWIGMTGLIFLLHFGLFKLLACFWRQNGICAQPLMRMPLAAKSVSDFWSKRWNSAFHDLSFGLLFSGFRKRCGVGAATMLTFIVSGLIHDLVISVPTGAGYGLPTAYFTFQGAGMLFEHSHAGVHLGPRGNWRGRLFAWAVIAGPVFALFPPAFVLRVIVPFMQAIKAIPGYQL